MMFYVVPNYIGDEIDRKLDDEIAKHPAAAADRELFRSQLIEYVAEHGVVPDFSLNRNSQPSGEG
jgi:hypothetical protein